MPSLAFQCPPDCGWCCTHLKKEASPELEAGEQEFRAVLRDEGVYHCTDATHAGLALAPDEAARLTTQAARRGIAANIHPRTFLLETRRRVAVVLEWHMPHETCPFYADYKCTAYDLRPLVCRAFPVMAPAPAWTLAPECPKIPGPRSNVRLGTLFRTENVARRAIERAHAALDERAQGILATEGARFAKGLEADEAERRVERYSRVAPNEWEHAWAARATR